MTDNDVTDSADMSAAEDQDALREELRVLDEEIADLKRTATGLRRQLGERWVAPTDSVEQATLLTEAEEQEAFIAELEARREELLERLSKK